MDVLIFKTNVTSKKKAGRVGALLASVKTIKDWNIDLEDCDKILRVVATGLNPAFVEVILQTAGFNCRVLDY